MPRYDENIDPAEISSVVSQSNVQMQRVAQGLDQMNAKMERMTSLFGKMRDYTRDELQEISSYKNEIKGIADAYRSMHGERSKGMSDYSVAMKAQEEKLDSLLAAQKRYDAEVKKMSERRNAIETAMSGRLTKTGRKTLEEELGAHGAKSKKLRQLGQEESQRLSKHITERKTLVREIEKEKESTTEQIKKAEKLHKLGVDRVEQAKKMRGMKTDLLEIASDLHLPGVSHAATIAKYAQRGAMGAGEGGGGRMSQLIGGLGGMAKGIGIAAGGFTALQGYRAYNLAHDIAPMARTLHGQMGAESVGGRRQAIQAYGGYGGAENLQLLMQLNRSLGGASGLGNLKSATDISNRFGISREEAAGQMGGAFMSGMGPKTAGRDLEAIMSEGVKGGMDRARITEFTQQVLSVQQEIFRATGKNNAQAIAQTMAQLMRASGQGEQFMRGPAMQGLMGIDQAVKGVGRGQVQGQAAGTLFRAFGFGAGGKGGVEGYLNARKFMEGGLFQGSSKEQIGNINKVFERYQMETGGKPGEALGGAAKLRMADELGIGINQVEQLDEIRRKAASGEGLGKDDLKKLAKLQEESKDPMLRIVELNAKMNESLAMLATSEGGIKGVIAIDKQILEAQNAANGFLQSIANALTGGGDSGDMMKTVLGGLGLGALLMPGKAAGAAGKIGGMAGSAVGGLAKMGGGGLMGFARAAGGVGLAGAGGYAVGTGINYLADEFTSEENQYGQKSNIFERGIGKAMTYAPEWMGGITDEQYKDMYGASPPRGGGPGGAGAPGGMMPGADPENTKATAKNTEAIMKLTETLAKQKGASTTPIPAKRQSSGSYR